MDTYENKYKEALKRARVWKEKSGMPKDKQGILDNIFPELAESEDERIRKALIDGFTVMKESKNCGKTFSNHNIPVADILVWLEKQNHDGKKWIYEDVYLKEKEQLIQDGIDEVLENPQKYKLEKQGEQKPNPYSGTSFEYNGHIWGMCARDNGVEILFDGELKAFLSLEKSFIYPIHHQPSLIPKSVQETINKEKVKPKFHKGDWIVNNSSGGVYQVTEIKDDEYCLWPLDAEIKGYLRIIDVDNDYHLWTIQDAKDGDVLAAELTENNDLGPFIAIYECRGLDFFNSHCFVSLDGKFYTDGSGHSIFKIHPATKEQRDLLFQKMKETGYEWDVEKKKLKKIEEKPTEWGEEDERMFNSCCAAVAAADYYTLDDKQDIENWLKAIKDRVQPKQEWSEEDEDILNFVIARLHSHPNIKFDEYKKEYNWLKSLKERFKNKL